MQPSIQRICSTRLRKLFLLFMSTGFTEFTGRGSGLVSDGGRRDPSRFQLQTFKSQLWPPTLVSLTQKCSTVLLVVMLLLLVLLQVVVAVVIFLSLQSHFVVCPSSRRQSLQQ